MQTEQHVTKIGVDDLLVRGGREELFHCQQLPLSHSVFTKARQREERRQAKAKEQPRPLRRALPDPKPYPVEALGILAPVVERLAETIQAPPALCGQSVLAAATLAVQPYCNVIIDGRVFPLSEYFITVGESGERKSAVDRVALRPHRDYEKTLADAYSEKSLDYENALAAYKKAREEALKKAKTRAEKKVALDALGPPSNEPLSPILLTEEPTYEGLIKLLLHGQPSLGLFADEGGRLIGGYAMNEDNQLKTASGLSELWDGKRVSRIRGGDGAALLYGRRVAMHLMAQPEVAQRLLGNALMLKQGVLSRCLVTWPTSTAGHRPYREVNLLTDPVINAYDARLRAILETPLPLAEDKRNELNPRLLPFADDAKALWIKFHDTIEAQLKDGEPLAPIRGFANKAAEHAARVAGTLTLVEDLTARVIPLDQVGNGIKLVQHYLAEALRLFHARASDPDLILAEKLLAWIYEQPRTYLSLVEIYQRGPNAIRDAATAKKAGGILVVHGWLTPVEGGMEIDGTFRRDVWEVRKNEL